MRTSRGLGVPAIIALMVMSIHSVSSTLTVDRSTCRAAMNSTEPPWCSAWTHSLIENCSPSIGRLRMALMLVFIVARIDSAMRAARGSDSGEATVPPTRAFTFLEARRHQLVEMPVVVRPSSESRTQASTNSSRAACTQKGSAPPPSLGMSASAADVNSARVVQSLKTDHCGQRSSNGFRMTSRVGS